MKNEKTQLLLKKFKTNDEMRQFLRDNVNRLQVSEANNILRTLNKIEDSENTFVDVIQKGAKLKGVPAIKNAELYQDVIEDLETQRGIAEFSRNTKLANKLQEQKWDVLESAEKEDVGIYLKKYYPKGYNLLAKTLITLEKSERSCYDWCIHKLVNEKNLSTIVRALENLAQVDTEVDSLVDKNLETNKGFRIPTINGMPIGGYGIVGDRIGNGILGLSRKIVELFSSEKVQENLKIGMNSLHKNFKTVIGATYDGINHIGEKIGEVAKNTLADTSKMLNNIDKGSKLSAFVEDVSTDLTNYNAKNTDIEKANNSKYFSNYRGRIVIKNGLSKATGGKIGSNFALGDFIFLDNNSSTNSKSFKDVLNHEYGHTVQSENMGLLPYVFKVAIPSVNGYNKSLKGLLSDDEYYAQPWERSADILGGVKNRQIPDGVEASTITKVGEKPDYLTPGVLYRQMIKELDRWYEK